jgi:hypothetical protein
VKGFTPERISVTLREPGILLSKRQAVDDTRGESNVVDQVSLTGKRVLWHGGSSGYAQFMLSGL